MSYCTAQDLVERFGEEELRQLTDRTDEGYVDDSVLGQAIADAEAEIDASLAVRYSLPLAPVPAVLTRIACDLARYALYKDRVTEQVRMRYEDARKFLDRLARGEVQLGVIAPPETSREVSIAAGAHVWGRDPEGGLQ